MEEKHYDPTSQGFAYLHKRFPDDTYPPHEYFEEILAFIDAHIKTNGKVLVHCSMGISRSGGIIVLWLLKEKPTWTWGDAVSYVSKTKFISPAVEIRESALDYLESIENCRRDY